MIHTNDLSKLKDFEVFSSIPEKHLDKYTPHFYCRTYKKNQYLFMEGDPRDRIFFLLDGYVMFERGSEEGTMLYLDFAKSHQMFPYNGLFKSETYKYTAIAVTDIVVYFIQTHILENFLKNNLKQLISIISRQSDIINVHEKRMQAIVIPNAQERVLHSLKYLMEDLGEQDGSEIVIPCPLTASLISRISGTTRETVSHLINQLKRDQIISVNSKKIRFHSPDYFQLD